MWSAVVLCETWLRKKLAGRVDVEWELDAPHKPAHGSAYFASDADLWFLLFCGATAVAAVQMLPGNPGFGSCVSAFVGGIALGTLLRVSWSTIAQRDPGGTDDYDDDREEATYQESDGEGGGTRSVQPHGGGGAGEENTGEENHAEEGASRGR